MANGQSDQTGGRSVTVLLIDAGMTSSWIKKQIEDIVRSVMASMGQPQTQPEAPLATTPACHAAACATDQQWKAARWIWAPAEAKAWIGVQHPHRAEVLTGLKRSTAARVCTGRAGPRPRTLALLRFLADHSRSKIRCAQRGAGGVGESAGGWLEVRSEISDKNRYLTRPRSADAVSVRRPSMR